MLPICAEIEAEISGMEPEEKQLFLQDMGLEESGLDRLIQACYSLLGLISYLTAAKEKGLVRSEGKDYVMQDGDIVLFRFNV